MVEYLYLHGFASSPQSAKAVFLAERFAACGQTLHILDLNQNDFAHLTLTRQIRQGVDWALQRDRITIVGSSLGGLTAAWITQNPSVTQRIERLVLLAPAFQFLAQWLPRLGTEALTQWATAGWLSLYHYGLGQEMPLAYQFITDAQQYDDAQLTAPVPTLILHGINDEVISVQASRDYAATRPWVSLVELISDHSLGDVQPLIWQNLQEFLPELSCGS